MKWETPDIEVLLWESDSLIVTSGDGMLSPDETPTYDGTIGDYDNIIGL